MNQFCCSGGAGVGVEARVAVVPATGSVVRGTVVSGAEIVVAVVGSAGVGSEAGFAFRAGVMRRMVSVGPFLSLAVFLSFGGIPLVLLGGGWAGSMASGLQVVLLSLVSWLKKTRKEFILSWLSSSRTNVKIAFFKHFLHWGWDWCAQERKSLFDKLSVECRIEFNPNESPMFILLCCSSLGHKMCLEQW